jgi:two-component system NtrC family sensor kinase
MKLARKAKSPLVIAILAILSAYAAFQWRREIVLTETSISMSYRVLVLATLAVVSVGLMIARALRLRERAQRADSGGFVGPLVFPQTDDLGELARQVNRKLAEEREARLAALEQLRHAERLATVEHLAAGIAHELGTPLSVASGRAELIATRDLPRSDVVHSARIIVEQADRMAAIIRQLLDFSRRRSGQRVTADLRQVVTSTLDLVSGIATKSRVEVVCDLGTVAVPVYIDRNQMQQALMNIVMKRDPSDAERRPLARRG